MNYIILYLTLSLFGCHNNFNYCGRQYEKKEVRVFIDDYRITANMYSVFDANTKEEAFGYYKNAIRNDTNFIYSRIEEYKDTVITKHFYLYNINRREDSVITKFVCTPSGLKIHSYRSFKNGVATDINPYQ